MSTFRTGLLRTHLANVSILRRRASVVKAPDTLERSLHLEVAEKYAGYSLPRYLVAVEWTTLDGRGRGDLVFVDDMEAVAAVVEVKNIHADSTSSTKQRRRRHVREQAKRYMESWKYAHPRHHVLGYTFTNLDGLDEMGSCII